MKKNSTNELLELSINIDGVPLFHSSSEQLWPILGSFKNSDIFIIALFYGKHKPDNVEPEDSVFHLKQYDDINEFKEFYNGLTDKEKRASLVRQIFYLSFYLFS